MPKRIFVVDDEPDILEFLQVILEEEGYTVAITDKDQFANANYYMLLEILPMLKGR